MGLLANPQRLPVARCGMTTGATGGGALILGGWVSWREGRRPEGAMSPRGHLRPLFLHQPWEAHPTPAAKVLPESLQLTPQREDVLPSRAPRPSVPTGCLECQFGFSQGPSHPSQIQE